jgi:hypothetical protein
MRRLLIILIGIVWALVLLSTLARLARRLGVAHYWPWDWRGHLAGET